MIVAAIAEPMPKLTIVIPSAVADLHRAAPAEHADAELVGERLDVVGEVGQQDVLAETP